MKNWVEGWGKGGRIWTAKNATETQVAIVQNDGKWLVNCIRVENGKRQGAKHNSVAADEAGLDECLVWLHELLVNGNDPAFDAVEAKGILMLIDPTAGPENFKPLK